MAIVFGRRLRPAVVSAFRIVIGLLFLCHGLASLVGIFGGVDWHGTTISPLSWPYGFAADVELVGGALVMIGLATRFAALIASGSMAFAYFDVQLPHGIWPITNGGELAALYSWSFLLLVAIGPGPISLDRLVAIVYARRRAAAATAGQETGARMSE